MAAALIVGSVSIFQQPNISAPVVELEEQDMSPELQKYLNRNYWENKQKEVTAKQSTPSQAKVFKDDSRSVTVVTTPSAPPPSFSEPTYTSVTSEPQVRHTDTHFLKQSIFLTECVNLAEVFRPQ